VRVAVGVAVSKTVEVGVTMAVAVGVATGVGVRVGVAVAGAVTVEVAVAVAVAAPGQMVPLGSITLKNAWVSTGSLLAVALVDWKAFQVTGKSIEWVQPATTIRPLESTLIPLARSMFPLPPSRVENVSWFEPAPLVGLSSRTNAVKGTVEKPYPTPVLLLLTRHAFGLKGNELTGNSPSACAEVVKPVR
jgi:hypothetical protein